MRTELLIAEKRTGKMWECSSVVKSATYTTNRADSPGTFKFTILKAGDISFVEGDIVRFSVDGQLIFYGWVFTKVKDRWGIIDVTCYDRLRYLKATASYSFYGQSASDIIRQIAEDCQLDVSTLADTGYKLPSLIAPEQTYIDIIQDALDQTLLNTGKLYIFFDDGNGLSLVESGDMVIDTVIGDKSLVTDYSYKTDIDDQTYNSIKLVKPNEETGKAEVYIAEDSANIERWGLLQLYQSANDDKNPAQLKAQAEATLKYYNQRMRTLKIESLGVIGIRAGQMILAKIKGLGDISLDQYVLLERVVHTFENDKHTMELELYSF